MTPLNKQAIKSFQALVALMTALNNAEETGAIQTLVECGYLRDPARVQELHDAVITFVEG